MRRGLTLIELVVSLVIVTFILTACGSMVFVAAKAMSSDSSNVGSDATAARSAASQVIDDLKMATAVTEQTTTAVTMTVPDRDGDGAAETIRYSWTGVAGAPLMRQYNSRAAGMVAANVQTLNFTYLSKTVGKPPPVTSAEQSQATHAATTGIASYALSNANTWASEYIKPTFTQTAQTSTTAWTITRCQIMLQRNLVSTGTVTVSLKYADTSKWPTGAVLQSGTISILSVLNTGMSWNDVSFPTPAALDPTKGVCLVVSFTPLLGSGGFLGYHNASTDTAIAWSTSSDGGSTWTAASTANSMQFRVWGTVTTQDSDTYAFQPLPPSAP